jgi:hypothetical protein
MLRLDPTELIGGLALAEGEPLFAGGSWYVAKACAAGLRYGFSRGALATCAFLTAELLVDSSNLVTFALTLSGAEDGARFRLTFGTLGQCQIRLRIPTKLVRLDEWLHGREGGWLKISCGGDRVDLSKVDRMMITVIHKAEGPARFCLTPMLATAEEPAKLTNPLLPKGALIDELGQSTLHEWQGKSRSQEEVTARLKEQLEKAPNHRFPMSFSRWGGWKELKFEGTGFFRKHHDGRRWWLVDPDGNAFWSSGADCVRVDCEATLAGLEPALAWLPHRDGPYEAAYEGKGRSGESISFLAVNLIRAFGPERWRERWAEVALAELRRLGMNTVGNWSEWGHARDAGFPYVRPLQPMRRAVPSAFRDMPDVFSPAFVEQAAEFAEQLRESADDPALIGYFLGNEPAWSFSKRPVAEDMMYATSSCETRRALAEFVRGRQGSDAGTSAAWGMDIRLSTLAEGEWSRPFTEAARADLKAFSTIMVDRLFRTISEACRRVDARHLNLGVRYGDPPPQWALEGMRCFDVFSSNWYQARVSPEYGTIGQYLNQPVLIGEWHFGALDAGLPASGLMRVKDQTARGRAFRVYLEDAAAQPWCVGAHWFTLYDQSALGRFDGENLNIGLLDICHRRYEELCDAARVSHERLYAVAGGEVEPYAEEPEYLPMVYA